MRWWLSKRPTSAACTYFVGSTIGLAGTLYKRLCFPIGLSSVFPGYTNSPKNSQPVVEGFAAVRPGPESIALKGTLPAGRRRQALFLAF